MVGYLARFANLRAGYSYLVGNVIDAGEDVAPRGQATKEIRGAVLVFENPIPSLPTRSGRRLNPAIGAAEALQLIGGFSDPAMMSRVSKNFAQFQDAGVFHGAYGTRLRPQLQPIYERLKADPDTRQAVVTIWDPLHDAMVRDSKDFPCTITLHFMVRSGKLELQTYMRSNDVWLGLPYDVFQFTQLQMTMANCLGYGYGNYVHHVGSLHIYERNIKDAFQMLDDPRPPTAKETWVEENPLPVGMVAYDSEWHSAQGLARALYEHNAQDLWYSHVLGDYLP